MGQYKDHNAWQQVLGAEAKARYRFEDLLAGEKAVVSERQKALAGLSSLQSVHAKSDPCLVAHPQPLVAKTPPCGRRPQGTATALTWQPTSGKSLSPSDPFLDSRLERLEVHLHRMHQFRAAGVKLDDVSSRVGSAVGSNANQSRRSTPLPKTLTTAGSATMLQRPSSVHSAANSEASKGPTYSEGQLSMRKTFVSNPKRAPQPFGRYTPFPAHVHHLLPRCGEVALGPGDMIDPARMDFEG